MCLKAKKNLLTLGWPADLVFLETWNFNVKLGKVRKFYLRETSIVKVFSKFIQVMNKN